MAGEFDLISTYFSPLAGPEGLGLIDDAACFSTSSSEDIIVTKDMLVEDVHFRGQDLAKMIGYKALAVNISDCIAKGAKPYLYWLGLALPNNTGEDWIREFSAGLNGAQATFDCKLAGGDTTAITGPKVISITLMGKVPKGQMIKRSSAMVGDDVYVTGTLGDAALGLWCLKNDRPQASGLIAAYQKPSPPVAFGQAIRGLANSSADVSDGLIADVGHIAKASGVGAVLHQNYLPVSADAYQLLETHPSLWPKVWTGGDDYQTVFTAPSGLQNEFSRLAEGLETRVSLIGEVTAGQGIQLLDQDGQTVQVTSGGYAHF